MKKIVLGLIFVAMLSLALAGCSNNDDSAAVEPTLTAKEMTEQMAETTEEPAQLELEGEQLKDFYNLDPELLEDYSIRIPMMNVKTNEIAIMKVKDEKDLQTVEEAAKKRAEAVQKQFEQYLQDQYENAKNYKLVTKGNYVLLIISDKADELLEVYDSFFEQK